jgi:hypothetical protein
MPFILATSILKSHFFNCAFLYPRRFISASLIHFYEHVRVINDALHEITFYNSDKGVGGKLTLSDALPISDVLTCAIHYLCILA